MKTKTLTLALPLALAVACASTERASSVESATEPDPQPSPAPAVPTDAGASADGEPEDGSTCPSPCGVSPQCGCKPNETCAPEPSGTPACVSSGTIPQGFACLSTRECAAGLLCVLGVCRAPCAAAGSACAGGTSCRLYAGAPDDAGAADAVLACPVSCAYDDEASCGFAKGALLAAACVYQAASDSVECAKVSAQQVQSGVCTEDAACGAGRGCIPQPGGYASCRRLCKVGDPNACGGCKAITPPRIVSGVTYGACP